MKYTNDTTSKDIANYDCKDSKVNVFFEFFFIFQFFTSMIAKENAERLPMQLLVGKRKVASVNFFSENETLYCFEIMKVLQ